MKNVIIIIVLVAVLVGTIGFASVMYNSLKDSVMDDLNNDNNNTQNNNQNNNSGENNTGNNDTNSGENSGNNSGNDNSGDNSDNKDDNTNKNEGLKKAPDMVLYDLSGNQVKLSDYFGKPIVLNFWASWCGQCKEEMPDFQEVYDQYGEDVVFLMVNRTDGSRESVKTATTFIISNQYSFPFLLDKSGEGPSKYGVAAIPYTFFINEDGYIVSQINAKINKARLLNEIEKIYNP